MSRRDLIIGIVVLALVAGFVYWRQSRTPTVPEVSPTPSAQERLEDRFNITIPEEVEKTELSDVSDLGVSGVATRLFEEDTFTLTVLADLPDQEQGFYQAWIQTGEEGEEDFERLSIGRLQVAKGGYLLEFSSNIDYSSYDRVIVSQETTADNEVEEVVLEGSF